MATTQQTPRHLVICVVTGPKPEVSLMAAISLLRLQTHLMSSPQPIRADMHFVSDINEALHTVHTTAEAEDASALIFDGCMGFDTAFALRALATDVPVLVGVYPMPVIDWQRVSSKPGGGEDVQNWGNVYNVKPLTSPDANGYIEVDRTAHLGLLWLRARVLRDIAARHPEVKGAEAGTAFACPGMYGGKMTSAHRRFLDLYNGPVRADPAAGATSSGPTEFGGCVGARNVLR